MCNASIDESPGLDNQVMFMSAISYAPEQNQLLAALSPEVMNRIYSSLELVVLKRGDILYESSGEGRRYVYFPVDCVISLLRDTENGGSVEIVMLGNEGMAGMSSIMGCESSPWRAIVQNAGFAYRLLGHKLKDEFSRHGEMLKLMLRYTQSRIVQMSQTAACNRHHSIDQQVCRWLLQSLDRLSGTTTITITQEGLANALGVRREGVTVAACKLDKLGLIKYSRGKITVVDRKRLEQLSCECYAAVRKETNRLLPVVHRNDPSVPAFGRNFLPIIERSFTTLSENELVAA